MKIAIIGNAGSGKSTLATKLHTMINIPLYHLDQYFWQPRWQRPDREEFEKTHHALCDKGNGLSGKSSEGWIIEGMAIRHFDYRAEKADIIIFLDIPVWLCLYRIFKRAFTGYGHVRSSSAHGCPERMPDREFLNYVLNFNHKQKPEIEKVLEKYKNQKKIFVIQNKKDIDTLIKKFELRSMLKI